MTLRSKIIAAFTVVVVGGTAVSTIIGSRIIHNALLDEARARNAHALSVARTVYQEEQQAVRAAVEHLSSTPDAPIDRGSLDFASTVPLGQISADSCLADPSLAPSIQRALAGVSQVSTQVVQPACLRAHGGALASRAPEGGLMILAMVARPGRCCLEYGAVLLNGRRDLVDRVRRLAYGDAKDEGRDIGAVSIVSGERWISSTLETPRLGGYLTTSEPIRNAAGDPVGALQAAMLEAPILAQRTKVMLTFLPVCGGGLVVVFAITYLITRRMISPLEEMAQAATTIAGGDLSVRVRAESRDEIGGLATSFNDMAASLQTMRSELEDWGRTLEARVHQRTAELGAAQLRMAQAEKLASIGRLAAGVAHSINNPLGGILSLSMLALEDVEGVSPIGEDLKTIADQAMRCREIVKGLLDFSREPDGRVVRVQVETLIDDALSLLECQGRLDGVDVVREFQGGGTPVLMEPGRLQEVVSNLVENAVDAMQKHGRLTVATDVAHGPEEAIVRISDTGPGIAAAAMPYLFEPFFTTKRVGKGTGLGLAIVHGIVTAAGGRVDVTSVPGNTSFTIRLPLARGEAA